MINHNNDHSTIVHGMATILWAMGWADHAEEHGCYNLSGCEITECMPPIPEQVYSLAERYLGRIEEANHTHEYALFYRALEADGLDPNAMFENERVKFNNLQERFGECLGYMVTGAGISWFDDHEKFDLKVPYCESGECHMIADDLCDEEDSEDD